MSNAYKKLPPLLRRRKKANEIRKAIELIADDLQDYNENLEKKKRKWRGCCEVLSSRNILRTAPKAANIFEQWFLPHDTFSAYWFEDAHEKHFMRDDFPEAQRHRKLALALFAEMVEKGDVIL